MPPFRFLHAAGLDPDAVLPAPPARLSEVFESAPLVAVERLVTCAIEQRVDFVLVTPSPPVAGLPDLPSLAAESALREQFDRLADEDIRVFVAVGSRSSGWERIAGGESKIVVLTPGSFAPIADRDGRPGAILRCVDRPTAAARSVAPGPNDVLEFAVAPRLSAQGLRGTTMVRHDYLALGDGPRSTAALAAGVAHSPGPLQATDAFETGPRGATLVTVEGGRVRTDFVSTAAVRFEAITIQGEHADQLDDLAIRMIDRLNEAQRQPGEQAWVVRWTLEVAGALFETLDSPADHADLVGLLPEEIDGASVAHTVTVVPHPLWPALEDPLAAEFAAALQEQAAILGDPARRLSTLTLPENMPHSSRLARLISGADAGTVVGAARRYGLSITTAAVGETETSPD